MAINNEPVNDQYEVQDNSENEGNNSCFSFGGGFSNTIGGSMHESDGGELAKYKDFEIVMKDDRNFILKHKEDLKPAVKITMREEEHGFSWIGLPDCLKEPLSAFREEDLEIYPGTLLKTILGQLQSPREELKDSEEVKKQISDAANILHDNPSHRYIVKGKLGEGFARVFTCIRSTDGKHFALKFLEPKNDTERKECIKEAGIQVMSAGEFIVERAEAYDY